MPNIEGLKELYLAIGVGGVSFIALIIILGYLLKQVFPILTQIMQMLEVLKEVLQNNNKAIDEMAKSHYGIKNFTKLHD